MGAEARSGFEGSGCRTSSHLNPTIHYASVRLRDLLRNFAPRKGLPHAWVLATGACIRVYALARWRNCHYGCRRFRQEFRARRAAERVQTHRGDPAHPRRPGGDGRAALGARPLHALHEAGRRAGLDGCDDDRGHSGRARRRDDQRADGGKAGAARGGPAGRAAGGVSGAAQAPDLRRHDSGRIRADCDVCRDTGKVVDPKTGNYTTRRTDAPRKTGDSKRDDLFTQTVHRCASVRLVLPVLYTVLLGTGDPHRNIPPHSTTVNPRRSGGVGRFSAWTDSLPRNGRKSMSTRITASGLGVTTNGARRSIVSRGRNVMK